MAPVMFAVGLTIKYPGQPNDTSRLSISDKHLRKLAKVKGFKILYLEMTSSRLSFAPFPGPAKVTPIEIALAQTGATIHIEIDRPSTRALNLLGAIRYGSKQESTKEIAPKPVRPPRRRKPSDSKRRTKLAAKYDHLIKPGSLAEAVKVQMTKVLEHGSGGTYQHADDRLLQVEFIRVPNSRSLGGIAGRLIKALVEGAPDVMIEEAVVYAKAREYMTSYLRDQKKLKLTDEALSVLFVTLVKLGHTQYAPK